MPLEVPIRCDLVAVAAAASLWIGAFEREVGKRIVCESPEAFRLRDTHLESELPARRHASLCKLVVSG